MKWSKFFLNFLFPENCKICQKLLHYNESLICTDCFLKLPFLKFYCSKCGNPFDEMLEDFFPNKKILYCGYCEKRKLYFDEVFIGFIYKPPISDWINDLKFAKNFSIGYKLGILIKKIFERKIPQVDLVISVPLSSNRLRERGFNQSYLIAWGFLGKKPKNDILKRVVHTKPQTELSQKERWENVKNAFLAEKDLKDKNILLIDDVMTTGATLNFASKALKEKGAKKVYALVVARSVF